MKKNDESKNFIKFSDMIGYSNQFENNMCTNMSRISDTAMYADKDIDTTSVNNFIESFTSNISEDGALENFLNTKTPSHKPNIVVNSPYSAFLNSNEDIMYEFDKNSLDVFKCDKDFEMYTRKQKYTVKDILSNRIEEIFRNVYMTICADLNSLIGNVKKSLIRHAPVATMYINNDKLKKYIDSLSISPKVFNDTLHIAYQYIHLYIYKMPFYHNMSEIDEYMTRNFKIYGIFNIITSLYNHIEKELIFKMSTENLDSDAMTCATMYVEPAIMDKIGLILPTYNDLLMLAYMRARIEIKRFLPHSMDLCLKDTIESEAPHMKDIMERLESIKEKRENDDLEDVTIIDF